MRQSTLAGAIGRRHVENKEDRVVVVVVYDCLKNPCLHRRQFIIRLCAVEIEVSAVSVGSGAAVPNI